MLRWIALGLVFCGLTSQAQADLVIGLYNTGVSSSGGLAPDGSADPHYQLIASADSSLSVPSSAYVSESSQYPFVPNGWLPNGPDSKWIGPIANQSLGNPPGDYTFQTTFQITGNNPTSVVISGQWALDNIGEDIVINGHSTGIYYDAPGDYTFAAFQSFVLPSMYFVSGTNTIDFVVYNTDNGNGNTPVGLRVEFNPVIGVPEPSGPMMFATGALILMTAGGVRRLVHCERKAI